MGRDFLLDSIAAKISNRLINPVSKRTPLMLMILDGWGLAPDWGGNAIALSKTPNFDQLWKGYPKTSLVASGTKVGLPADAPGNSEAGHLNIGAGRIVHQDIQVIDEQIANGHFYQSKVMLELISHTQELKSNFHILGLLSKTGIHSHIKHLAPILYLLRQKGVKNVYLHLFSDGRDSDPMSGIVYLDEVDKMIKYYEVGQISSIMGRFFAMDRDNRWGRTARAYNALVKGEAEKSDSSRRIFSLSYTNRITDEFIEPKIVVNPHQSFAPISNNDSILFFNFRSDRIKQLIRAFLDIELDHFFDRQKLENIKLATFTVYRSDDDLSEHVFSPEKVQFPIGKVISDQNLSQLHCAETEKFPHVTYFINGGESKQFPKESDILIPSPQVRTYDLAPKMSAQGVTDTLLKNLERSAFDSYIVNYANPDMVGHTGNLQAVILAIAFVDQCLGTVVKEVLKREGTAIICADHGNAEQMVNPLTGDPDTEHTANPVPFIIVNNQLKDKVALQLDGALSNIAPTILDLCGLDKPAQMSSQLSLIIKKS